LCESRVFLQVSQWILLPPWILLVPWNFRSGHETIKIMWIIYEKCMKLGWSAVNCWWILYETIWNCVNLLFGCWYMFENRAILLYILHESSEKCLWIFGKLIEFFCLGWSAANCWWILYETIWNCLNLLFGCWYMFENRAILLYILHDSSENCF
jgi:hypothetical protein